jgi:hypothetical protein
MKRIYFAVVRFVGEVLFALLKYNGVKHIEVIDPTIGEVLLEFSVEGN